MMKNWMTGWFGGEQADTAVATPADAAAHLAAAAIELDPAALDPAFYRWLTRPGAGAPAPGTERLLLDELSRMADSPGAGAHLIPRVPAVVPQLLSSLRDDSISTATLSTILAQDVVLVGEVIRGANSPYYRSSTPIKTIESALMLLGQNGMRLLLARVAFRPVISAQTGHLARLAAPQVWRHSEKCALAANLLAPAQQANPFESYLAGLMQNVGLVVAFRLFDQLYPNGVLPQSPQFYAALVEHGRTLSARIATMWEFPASISTAIAHAGHPSLSALVRTLAMADRLAKLRMLAEVGQLGLDEESVLASLDGPTQACFAKLGAEQS
jgi:HD-like signal output (HDOD) protein